jgi:GNAT superfamily N-acetyltransferase
MLLEKGLRDIPKNIDVTGTLDLRRTGITSLPEGLHVGGGLDLRGTGITSLPEGLRVGGGLDLRGTGITSLPEGLRVGGGLDLRGTGITSLPEGLRVGGGLDLRGTGTTSLPEGLHVGGDLNLEGSGVRSLPEGLHVGGDLNLEGSGIGSLPEGLHVGGDLNLEGTGITSLPEGLHVGDSLILADSDIKSLPEGLHVGGDLILEGTGITSLPKGLHVGGFLDLVGTGITSLPEGLHVGGSLYLKGTGITSLPEGLHVGGNLNLRGTGIKSLPGDLHVGRDLYLEGTGITSLPEGLHVGRNIGLRNSHLSPGSVMSKVHPNLSELHKTSLVKAIKDSMGVDDIEKLTQEELQSATGLIRSLKSKTFQKMAERLEAGNPDNSSWSTHSALGLVNTFGNDSAQWLDIQTKAGRTLHDASFWLPIKSAKELNGLDTWLRKNYKHSGAGADNLRPIEDLSVVAQNWAGLNASERQLRYKDLLSLVKSRKYLNQADELFATESAKWGIAPSDYKAIENRYLASLSTKVPFPIEQRWNEGEFTGRFLPRNDARGLYLGQHTDCCQHPKGAGATSAWYGQESPNSGFFVVEDKNGQVVAQSWAWLSDDGAVVFDNIEAKGLGDRESKVAAIYQKVGDSLAQSHYKVTIGSGESDVALSRWKATDAVPLPRDSSAYTDAKSQVLLSANAKIKPAPISKLNNWVQGLLPSDKAQIEKIAKAFYPEGRPVTPEGDFGLALKDKNKGTIGYAMIDSENHEVTDIAVLPEHRNQSRLLINALFDHVRRVGGDWTADMRESSSYKLLKAYEKWGRVEILEDKVSGNMGSEQMHSVKLRLPERSK